MFNLSLLFEENKFKVSAVDIKITKIGKVSEHTLKLSYLLRKGSVDNRLERRYQFLNSKTKCDSFE